MFVTENYDEIVEEIEVESDDEYEERVSKQIVIKKILFHSNYECFFFLHNFSVLFSANISKIAGKNAENLT